ncbi:MAG: zf-TFIIB domain-containing protein [Planctomycetaceae bacterium]|nr:zf-TFIIB domain-containing protein [Planctomycetaceae bacterium]
MKTIPPEAQSGTRAINCPQCGGLVQPVAGHEYFTCRFCTSLVFSTDHPLAKDRITPTGQMLESRCPCCSVPLATGALDDQPAAFCEECCGVLMSRPQFATALRQRRARRTNLDSELAPPIDTRQYERRIHCPNCRRKMDVHPYYGPGNVVIDSCCDCNLVWLDHGEMSRIERAAGGTESGWRQPDAALCNPQNVSSLGSHPVESTHPLQQIADWLFG